MPSLIINRKEKKSYWLAHYLSNSLSVSYTRIKMTLYCRCACVEKGTIKRQ